LTRPVGTEILVTSAGC